MIVVFTLSLKFNCCPDALQIFTPVSPKRANGIPISVQCIQQCRIGNAGALTGEPTGLLMRLVFPLRGANPLNASFLDALSAKVCNKPKDIEGEYSGNDQPGHHHLLSRAATPGHGAPSAFDLRSS